MLLSYHPMKIADAGKIVTWKYEEEYAMYSFSESNEDIQELMNGEYFSVLDELERLVGFICCGESARVPGGTSIGLYQEEGYLDIGLGLDPDLTGQKIGSVFLKQSLVFLQNHFKSSQFRLVVATFNERAIKVYERTGFKRDKKFYSKVHDEDRLFISMKMKMPIYSFEEITEQDLTEVREIYNYYVSNTTISFHTEELTLEEIKASVMNINPRFKSFVIKEENEIQGYVLITQYKSKQAYDFSGEVTIYLKPDIVGKGIGATALRFIENVAREQGFYTLIATVCMENTRSKSMFEKHGYEQCAMFKGVGYKFDRRLDIGSFQKVL
ncbi:GNAT family N-acetyltransferase [Paenibacillus sp. AD87]|uniref:GNAT family N-acetyltransferase n=1 Tax=Paenibacillus sp. AD87 TaxID=1528787 RepID=UPI0007FFB2BA|nr:GNAT family N-acetyltransferase [Paenibacillus sp. AD87]OAX50251.1 Phosphinothricin N-acetyltransferase [Paenibacillus sp. AD87]